MCSSTALPLANRKYTINLQNLTHWIATALVNGSIVLVSNWSKFKIIKKERKKKENARLD